MTGDDKTLLGDEILKNSSQEEIVVRQYGLLPPKDWGDDCEEEMRRATKLWNNLVEIENKHQTAYRDLLNSDDTVADLAATIEALTAKRSDLDAQRKAQRSAGRRRVATPEIDAEILIISGRLRDLYAELKESRTVARTKNRAALDTLELARRAAVKSARQESGLWWQNCDPVVASYDAARKRALKDGGQLRFRSHAHARIRVVNRDRRNIPVADLFSGRGMFSVAPLPPNAFNHASKGERRRLQRTTLTAVVYNKDRKPRTVTWPMTMHRPIPDNCTIRYAIVTREKIGPRVEWKVTFTCFREPGEREPSASHVVAGVDFGWRRLNEGVRVGMVAASDGTCEPIVMPQHVLDRYAYIGELSSMRDTSRNDMLETLGSVSWSDAPEELRALWKEIQKAPMVSSPRLRGLLEIWPRQQWQNDLRKKLARWARADLRDWRELVGLRRHMLLNRRDLYRQVGKKLAEQYGTIVVNALRLTAPRKSAVSSTTEVPTAVRRLQALAAPGELREAIKLAVKARHGTFLEHAGALSSECSNCGSRMTLDKGTLHVRCSHCDTLWDQDENAAWNLVKVARNSDNVRPDIKKADRKQKDTEN